ncbi:hypothetical protein ACS0TY_004258 [Phlomoides rotata]
MGKVRCSVEGKGEGKELKLGMEALMMAVACAAAMSSPAALALLDERMRWRDLGFHLGSTTTFCCWIEIGDGGGDLCGGDVDPCRPVG